MDLPEFGFPKAVGQPVDRFGIVWVGELDNKTVGKGFFLGFTTVQSFVKDKDLVAFVAGVFLVCFNDEIRHSTWIFG